jgi:hypothetical protein
VVVQEDLEIEMQAAAVQVLADRGTVSAMAMVPLVVRNSKAAMVLGTTTTKAAHQTAESKFQAVISTFKLRMRSSRRNLLLPPVPRAAVWMVFK